MIAAGGGWPEISFLLLGGHQVGKDEAVAFDDFAGRDLQRSGCNIDGCGRPVISFGWVSV